MQIFLTTTNERSGSKSRENLTQHVFEPDWVDKVQPTSTTRKNGPNPLRIDSAKLD